MDIIGTRGILGNATGVVANSNFSPIIIPVEEEYYSSEQWWDEIQKGKLCGRHTPAGGVCNLKCPDCGAYGWYGARVEPFIDGRDVRLTQDYVITDGKSYPITRKYRCCKWCGLLQEAWGKVLDDDPRKSNPHKACLRRHKKCTRGIEPTWATFLPEGVFCEDCAENVEQFVPKDEPTFQKDKELLDGLHNITSQNVHNVHEVH